MEGLNYMTSFYGSSGANKGKGALDTPETRDRHHWGVVRALAVIGLRGRGHTDLTGDTLRFVVGGSY
eukprot:1183913-Prorocentrum_minimum.AAC.1